MTVLPGIRFGIAVKESKFGSLSAPAPISGSQLVVVPTVARVSLTFGPVSPSSSVAPSRPQTVFARRNGILKVIVPWIVSGLDAQTNGAPAFEIFLRRPLQICDSRLSESGRVSQVDRSAEFRERGQADLYRSGTQ
jgi:hypothetical protein